MEWNCRIILYFSYVFETSAFRINKSTGFWRPGTSFSGSIVCSLAEGRRSVEISNLALLSCAPLGTEAAWPRMRSRPARGKCHTPYNLVTQKQLPQLPKKFRKTKAYPLRISFRMKGGNRRTPLYLFAWVSVNFGSAVLKCAGAGPSLTGRLVGFRKCFNKFSLSQCLLRE